MLRSYILKEKSGQLMVPSKETSQDAYKINNLGTNDDGKDLIFRIRSKRWDREARLKTRCIILSGAGHIFDGTWSYTESKCFPTCPKDQNCNRA